jgi:hypothetical protein
LEAVRDFVAAAAIADQVVAVARGLENLELFLHGASGERVARTVIERNELCLAGVGNREPGHEGVGRPIRPTRPHAVAFRQGKRIATHQGIPSERLAGEKDRARKSERRVEPAIESSLEPAYVDTEVAQ